MKLLKLTLHNFKGVRSFEFTPNGESVSVLGANESGKTTLADAITWLLFDKDTQGRSPEAFGIKTRVDGKVQHGLDHEVEGIFDQIKLRKVYKEKWTRKRGSAKEEFSGHTTDYYVNDVPVKASDYKAAVSDIMSEERFRMLTVPSYFPESLHWTERRRVLFELAGEIDTDQIISSHEGLESYKEILGDYTHEEREKILVAQRRDLNKQIDSIPVRIDEATRQLVEVEGVEKAKERIEELQGQKEAIEQKINEIRAGGGVSELRVKIQEIEAEKARYMNEFNVKVQESLSELREKVSELEGRVDESSSELRDAKRKYEDLKAQVEQAEEELQALAGDIDAASSSQPDPKPEKPEDCPYCGQSMPDHGDHYEQYLAEFNTQKAERIKRLKESFTKKQDEIESLSEGLEQAKQAGLQVKARHEQRSQALESARAELQAKRDQAPQPDTSSFEAQKRALQERIDNQISERQERIDELQAAVQELESQIEDQRRVILQDENNRRIHERIKELQEERKRIHSLLEQVEEDLYVMEQFVRARSAYVTARVNEKFQSVKWMLFRDQINGGVEECCEAIFKGVPFSEGLNNAGRIQAGLDIIATLSKHYGVSAPVIIDNAEAVSDIPDYDLQIIALYVSAGHKQLTVAPKPQLQVA